MKTNKPNNYKVDPTDLQMDLEEEWSELVNDSNNGADHVDFSGLTEPGDLMAQERTEMAQERTSMAEKRTSMAKNRTKMAFERTSLSNSQTFLAYIRTAVAIFAAGIGMFEFVEHPVIIKVGIAFMAVAPVMLIVGIVHFFVVRKKLSNWLKK